MLLPALIAVSAVGLGLLFGLAPVGTGRVIGPLRTFALTAALSVAGTHLLPEAFAELGAVGLAVFALGLALPSLFRIAQAWRPSSAPPREDAALEFGYVGLLVHHLADGLGLGAYGGGVDREHAGHGAHGAHADVLVALAIHTVPLVAVVTLAYRSIGGVRAAVVRSAGLAAASLVGIAVSFSVSAAQAARFEAWVAAGVAGLLVHVVTHDLDRDLPSSVAARGLDLIAALAGVVVSLVAASELGPEAVWSGAVRVFDLLAFVAPPLAISFLLSAALDTWLDQQRASGGAPEALRLFSLRSALSVREHPHTLATQSPRIAYLSLSLAFAVGFDAIVLGLWLAGPGVELARLLGVFVLAAVGSLLLPLGERRMRELDSGEPRGFVAHFVDSVSRASPWLFTGVLLATMLDASLDPDALASTELWVLLLFVSVLALPVQLEAAAAGPVLAVLVHKGLPVPVALAGWIVIAAPGERGLLTLLRDRPGKALSLLGVTLLLAVAAGFAAQAARLTFFPLGATAAAELLGGPATLLLALPVLYTVWNSGLRGWLSTVFLHVHHHAAHHGVTRH